MKKFYTLALAAFATLAMNAQVYVVGNVDGVDHWTPENPAYVGTLNAAGNYEVYLPNTGSFKISTTKGTWDDFNAGAFSVNQGNISKAFMNDFFDVEPWGNDTMLPWKGDWTLEVTPDYTKMKLTTTTPEATEAVPAYIIGANTDWGFDDAWLMTSPKLFEYTFMFEGDKTIAPDVEFKIGAAGWTLINYTIGGEILTDGEPNEVPYNEGANMYFADEFLGLCTLEMPNGYNQPAIITFTPKGDGIESVMVSDNAPAEYFNLQGIRVANPEQGLYLVRKGNKVSKVLVK